MGRKSREKRLKRQAWRARPIGSPSPPSGRRLLQGFFLFFALGMGGWWAWSRFWHHSQSLDHYGRMRVLRESNGGPTLYIVPMEHYYVPPTAAGLQREAEQNPTLAPIQMEIYRILERLHESGEVDLDFGEGLEGELSIPYGKRGWSQADYEDLRRRVEDDAFLTAFFRANPKETGYTAYEIFHPDIVTWGDDPKENHLLFQRLEQELCDFVASHGVMDPQYAEFYRRNQGEKDRISGMRSLRTLGSALARCEALHKSGRIRKRAVAIIIGSAHVPQIEQEVLKNHPGVGMVEIWPVTLPPDSGEGAIGGSPVFK